MPNIVEYNSQSDITPSDKGIQAAETAGRRIGQFYHQLASDVSDVTDAVERHMAVMETSELYKTGTELRFNLQQRFDQESALPENRNDPHFGDRFMAEVSPLLDQWGDAAKTEHGKQLADTLKAGIRTDVFNHVAAGQSAMDTAHVLDNLGQTRNLLGAGLQTDPSEANYSKTLGTWNDSVDGMTMAIPDVETRERVASELREQGQQQLTIARYRGVAQSVENQVGETGDETKSPAAVQLDKDIAGQLGFQYLTPEQQASVTALKDEAVKSGQALYRSSLATAKSQMETEGKAAYADINTQITELMLNGQGPTPELLKAIGAFDSKYGAFLPGEVASLNDYAVKGQDRAQQNKVQPFNQATRDSIQAGMGTPAVTHATLLHDWNAGHITTDDYRMYDEILTKQEKPEKDPAFTHAFEELKRWQNLIIQSIGGGNTGPAAVTARAAFIHDSTVSFMARGKAKDWDAALDGVINPKNLGSFANMVEPYNRAATSSDANKWLQQHWRTWGANGMPSSPPGSKTNPIITPHGQQPAPQAEKIGDKDVDAILDGKR